MEHFAFFRLTDDNFISGQIKFDAWSIASAAKRTTVGHPSFSRKAAAWIRENLEANITSNRVEATLFPDPTSNYRKSTPQERLIEMSSVRDGKVEVFRETVRFEITLLKASPTLENPAAPKLFISMNTSQQPAERIILLDDVSLESHLAAEIQYLLAINH